MKTSISLLFAIAAVLLLPSCTCWQLGERLRAPYVAYTGLDIERPADGHVYHKPVRGWEVAETCYVSAPEKTYNIVPPLFYDASGLSGPPKMEAANLRPTGRVVPVALRRDEKGNYEYERTLLALPGGLVAEDYATSPQLAQARENARQTGNKQRPLPAENGADATPIRTEPGVGRRLLIGSCDYVIEPLLTIVTCPVEWTCSLVALPFVIIYECVAED